MIQKTVTNLYPFIVSQLPRKYKAAIQRRSFFTKYAVLILDKGPHHTLSVHYDDTTEDFQITLVKPCGVTNEVTIHKYA